MGVALQAEHDDPAERAAAPLLALFDPAAGSLRAVAAPQVPSGYAGDIAALQGEWWLSCPREHRVQRLLANGGALAPLPLRSACALVGGEPEAGVWVLGDALVTTAGPWRQRGSGVAGPVLPVLPAGGRFDNHAVRWRWPAG